MVIEKMLVNRCSMKGLVSRIPDTVCHELFGTSRQIKLKPGSLLWEEGVPAKRMYMILSGSVLIKNEARLGAQLWHTPWIAVKSVVMDLRNEIELAISELREMQRNLESKDEDGMSSNSEMAKTGAKITDGETTELKKQEREPNNEQDEVIEEEKRLNPLSLSRKDPNGTLSSSDAIDTDANALESGQFNGAANIPDTLCP